MPEPKETTDAIVIHAVGNVGPRRVEHGEPVESLFGKVHQRIKEADITLCSLEMIFSTRGCLQYRDHVTWDSRADPGNVKALALAGFNVVSHASNRCFDYGPDALLQSIDTLRSSGMQVVGAGKDIAEARAAAIVEQRGIKVGFLGYNSVLPAEYEAREGKPGCAPIRVSTYFEPQGYQPGTPPKVITIPNENDVRAMEQDIRALRSRVDVVVVSIHWGLSSVPGMVMYQPVVGRRAVDAGADLIFGSHGSTIRGAEMYRGRAIFYCLGSFAQDRAYSFKPPPSGTLVRSVPGRHREWEREPGWERNPGPKNRRYTMMVKCLAGKNGLRKVSFLPGWTNERSEPELLSPGDQRFKEVLDYIEPGCQELGSRLTVEGDEVVVHSSASKQGIA
ncbi:MAG: CapA family protein [Chloroflexi bacterium]|nr:CapA family protein [Chloroflexota bacterium]